MHPNLTVSPLVLACAVRYALGRQTYVVGDVARAVRNNVDQLGEMRVTIARDIREWVQHVEGFDHPRDLVDEWTQTLSVLEG